MESRQGLYVLGTESVASIAAIRHNVGQVEEELQTLGVTLPVAADAQQRQKISAQIRKKA